MYLHRHLRDLFRGYWSVVHQAPGFGEDDYRICLANQVFLKNEAVLCPVDESGLFTEEVTEYAGVYVKVHTKPPSS